MSSSETEAPDGEETEPGDQGDAQTPGDPAAPGQQGPLSVTDVETPDPGQTPPDTGESNGEPAETPEWAVGDPVEYSWTDPAGPQQRFGQVHAVTDAGIIVAWLDLAGPIALDDPGLSHGDEEPAAAG